MKKTKGIFLSFIILGLVPFQVLCGEKEQLELAFTIVEKTRISKIFVDLSEAFMETYFERYETTGGQESAPVNPLKKIFLPPITAPPNASP